MQQLKKEKKQNYFNLMKTILYLFQSKDVVKLQYVAAAEEYTKRTFHQPPKDVPTQLYGTFLFIPNSSLGESGSPKSDPWDKHLHRQKKEEGQTKKRKEKKFPTP